MLEYKKKCFVIMPISDAEGYDKGHFTRVYEHLIKPAVIEAGFEPVRADDTSKANFIVMDILQQILACDMAICDLSSRNPNVFYELGVRQSFNKRTVLICDKNTVKPFDTSGIRTLDYSSSLRIDEVKKSIPEIAKCIKDTYEADAKEVNSLLQLLSIEPAVLPDKVTLSQDSSMILTAINDLNKKITLMMPPIENCTVNDKAVIRLPNGELVHIGDIIYSDDNFGTPLGTLEGDNRTHIMIRNDKKELVAIPRKSEKVFRLATLPF